jgi:predicted small lipoprotein YifL
MFKSQTAIAGILLLLVLLQGCGRKGPLYMPQVVATPALAVKDQPAQSQPVPAQSISSQPETK